MRYKVTVAYDGSNYFGWQSQVDVVNIQDVIEEALRIIHKKEVRITGSGRTDRGVHARGQVFHFDTELNISEENWVKAFNANLPHDIRVLKVEAVSERFHARYDVVSKQYDYYLNMGEYDLFQRDYVTQVCEKLDVEKMRDAREVFLGTHDFSSFSANSFEETPDQVRTVHSIDITQQGDILRFSFLGNGFMRYMVRMMMGVLIEVGKGKLTKEDVQKILDAHSKTAHRYKAESVGLYLTKVNYPLD